MRPDEIAERLGVSRYTVAQMLLAAKSGVKL
jgi:DNA-binding transcriptional regulator LsrR (DeoR family)